MPHFPCVCNVATLLKGSLIDSLILRTCMFRIYGGGMTLSSGPYYLLRNSKCQQSCRRRNEPIVRRTEPWWVIMYSYLLCLCFVFRGLHLSRYSYRVGEDLPVTSECGRVRSYKHSQSAVGGCSDCCCYCRLAISPLSGRV